MAAVESLHIVWRPVLTVLTVALLNDPGLQRNRPTITSLVSQYPGTCSGESVDRQNDCAPVLCAVACLLLYVRPYIAVVCN